MAPALGPAQVDALYGRAALRFGARDRDGAKADLDALDRTLAPQAHRKDSTHAVAQPLLRGRHDDGRRSRAGHGDCDEAIDAAPKKATCFHDTDLLACAESLASENASRLAAMERAARNNDDLLHDLQREFRQVRQDVVDAELFDVTAGSAAKS